MELIVITVILIFLVVIALPLRDRDMYWTNKYKELEASHHALKSSYEKTVRVMQSHIDFEEKAILKSFKTKIDEYFEDDFEITTRYIQVIDDDVILKLGNEDCLHEVKLSLEEDGTIEITDFLEKAKAEWRVKKDEQ